MFNSGLLKQAILFLLFFTLQIEQVVATSCSQNNIATVKAQTANPDHFCKFYLSRNRKLSPLPALTVAEINNACICMGYAKPRVIAPPSGPSVQTGITSCKARDINIVKKEFFHSLAFCRFYNAWSYIGGKRPIDGLSMQATLTDFVAHLYDLEVDSSSTVVVFESDSHDRKHDNYEGDDDDNNDDPSIFTKHKHYSFYHHNPNNHNVFFHYNQYPDVFHYCNHYHDAFHYHDSFHYYYYYYLDSFHNYDHYLDSFLYYDHRRTDNNDRPQLRHNIPHYLDDRHESLPRLLHVWYLHPGLRDNRYLPIERNIDQARRIPERRRGSSGIDVCILGARESGGSESRQLQRVQGAQQHHVVVQMVARSNGDGRGV
ncbi:hypothetical protein K461DRAFT_318158 [Myriangium duriaei CBS 260.36]|uniref:Uncharacterized protein n=1 Tax=Myriangium duriaei CBS 260.36 TaxID=1168546 RepID=A0A9P4JDJ9_9PEZI|nr:hypothetical protein K461DRAFT_318158 [Myriangium duriaei CBS 260.36]